MFHAFPEQRAHCDDWCNRNPPKAVIGCVSCPKSEIVFAIFYQNADQGGGAKPNSRWGIKDYG
jgi:hypothetical protein